MKILLVEDHPESRLNLQRLMERRGHEVLGVGSAEEAKEALQKQSYAFLILDWMLPGQSGIDLCRELRAAANGDEMFILLVTARDHTDDLEQALAAGANDYLTKPLDVALLNIRLSVAERQIRDLAERNHARGALIESARTLTNILENTTDAFFSLNHNWNFTYLNPEAERLLARKRDDLIGRQIWQEFPELVGTVFEENYRRVLAEEVAIEFEASDSAGRVWFELMRIPAAPGCLFFSVTSPSANERKRNGLRRVNWSR